MPEAARPRLTLCDKILLRLNRPKGRSGLPPVDVAAHRAGARAKVLDPDHSAEFHASFSRRLPADGNHPRQERSNPVFERLAYRPPSSQHRLHPAELLPESVCFACQESGVRSKCLWRSLNNDVKSTPSRILHQKKADE